jgi:hypothetical protein
LEVAFETSTLLVDLVLAIAATLLNGINTSQAYSRLQAYNETQRQQWQSALSAAKDKVANMPSPRALADESGYVAILDAKATSLEKQAHKLKYKSEDEMQAAEYAAGLHDQSRSYDIDLEAMSARTDANAAAARYTDDLQSVRDARSELEAAESSSPSVSAWNIPIRNIQVEIEIVAVAVAVALIAPIFLKRALTPP